ncbi:MAG: type II toxin-antitoxin system ParD family antitoxin [Xenococcus sp. MO_188.B8]|nr:type II toxin-antitoxin system ParD family antitoxin [Xenococcus sp. MO_188.B8]
MEIQLSSEQEKFIQEKITSGEYINANEIISEALKLLELRESKIKELKAQIAIDTEQIAQGKVTDGEVVFQRLQEKINHISQE